MASPGTGKPYTVRSLAEASGCGPGLIQKLASGNQPTANVHDAHALAEALGVAILVLFMPPVTPNRVTMTTDEDPEQE
jgi:transcriptional regulator with XRE-family HTH domain